MSKIPQETPQFNSINNCTSVKKVEFNYTPDDEHQNLSIK